MPGAGPELPERFVSSSAEATERAGASVASRLSPGAVVLISGELGAGKTTFVRGALRALGVREAVTSPTFVVGHLYNGSRGPVAHLDFYRLAGSDDEDPGLLDPYFGPEIISFVEWPEHGSAIASDVASHVAARVALQHAGGDERTIEVVWA
jgi:tRNA threonylcarbamoyladenosine biosynthesis protein TsaE